MLLTLIINFDPSYRNLKETNKKQESYLYCADVMTSICSWHGGDSWLRQADEKKIQGYQEQLPADSCHEDTLYYLFNMLSYMTVQYIYFILK